MNMKSNSANSEYPLNPLKGMLINTTFKTWDTSTTIFYQVTTYIFGEDGLTTLLTKLIWCSQSCCWHRWCFLLWCKCGDSRLGIQARFVPKKQKTKCYLNWTLLYYQGPHGKNAGNGSILSGDTVGCVLLRLASNEISFCFCVKSSCTLMSFKKLFFFFFSLDT